MQLQLYSLQLQTRKACRDLIFGVHSGFPWCCVWAFVQDRLAGVQLVGEHRWQAMGLGGRDALPPWCRSVGYVMCPGCFERQRLGTFTAATVHDCDDACHQVAYQVLRLLPYQADVL